MLNVIIGMTLKESTGSLSEMETLGDVVGVVMQFIRIDLRILQRWLFASLHCITQEELNDFYDGGYLDLAVGKHSVARLHSQLLTFIKLTSCYLRWYSLVLRFLQ